VCAGHCFLIEEGGETGNTFINNLGIRTRAAPSHDSSHGRPRRAPPRRTTNPRLLDHEPRQQFHRQRAAGSEDSGFWMEFRVQNAGVLGCLEEDEKPGAVSVPRVGTFSGNTAHSNKFAGFGPDPHGYHPTSNNKAVWVEVRNRTVPLVVLLSLYTFRVQDHPYGCHHRQQSRMV